jgi:hypothetical protein
LAAFGRCCRSPISHFPAFEIPALAHAPLDDRELLLVDEYRQIAGVGEIDESDEICRAPDPIIVLGRQIGEGGSEQSASEIALTSRTPVEASTTSRAAIGPSRR